MFTTDMKAVLIRDLGRLKEELHLYKNPAEMWKIVPGISNSAGNLALHLVGNLRHFIGHELGKSGYIRQRDEEFSLKNVSMSDLDTLISNCIKEVTVALDHLDPAELTKEFPKEVGGQKRDTSFVLLHLLGHLSYHLGQINYHRRIITDSGN